jgi:tetrahydromethanopterin S-methyltransferase subunit E
LPSIRLLLVVGALALAADGAFGKSGGKDSEGAHQAQHRSNYAAGVPRNAHGRIARDPRARNEFKRTHPCPATGKSGGSCPGYVIDHVQPLKRGGADTPANMEWQSEGAAKIKDRTE